MDGRAVDVGKCGVGFVEEQREVGAGDEDDVDGVSLAKRVGEGGEGFVLLRRAEAVAKQVDVDGVNEVDFVRMGANELDVREQAEEA